MGELPQGFFSLSEPARDRFLRDRALAFLAENPGTGLRLYLSRFFYLWTWQPGVGSEHPAVHRWTYLVLWVLTLPLIFLGWHLARRRTDAGAPNLFLALWTFMSVLYAAFAVNLRFRFESEALLVPYALLAVNEGWNRWRGRDRAS